MTQQVKAANSMPKKHAEPVMSIQYITNNVEKDFIKIQEWLEALSHNGIETESQLSEPVKDLRRMRIGFYTAINSVSLEHIVEQLSDLAKWSIAVSYHKQEPKVVLGPPLAPYELSDNKEQQYLELLGNITKALVQATKK